MAVIEFGNFLWNGQDRRYFKAVATLISGYRLFFWLKKSDLRDVKSPDRINIYWYIEFTGFARGWGMCAFRFSSGDKKKYI